MKKRLLSLLLVMVFVLSFIPAMAMAESASNLTPADLTSDDGLVTSKKLKDNGDGSYDLTLETYAKGKIETGIEQKQVPTDFVLVVDQSSSMNTQDMPTTFVEADMPEGGWTFDSFDNGTDVDGNKVDKELYYYDEETDEYYRVYRKWGALYEPIARNKMYVQDVIDRNGLSWFRDAGEQTQTFYCSYYYRPASDPAISLSDPDVASDGNFYPVKITVTNGSLHYKIHFNYEDIDGNARTIYGYNDPSTYDSTDLTKGNAVIYHNVLGGGLYVPGDGLYDQANNVVVRVARGEGLASAVTSALSTVSVGSFSSYTYAEFLGINTGMHIQNPLFIGHVGYNSLAYRDANGDEVILDHTDYCDSDGAPTKDETGTAYSNSKLTLYEPTSKESEKPRLDATQDALKAFCEKIAEQKDGDDPVDHRVAIVGFSSDKSFNNNELLTNTSDDFAVQTTSTWGTATSSMSHYSYDGNAHDGIQKATADSNKDYYAKALVSAYDEASDGVNEALTKGIMGLTAYGGTNPNVGLDMAYEILSRNDKASEYAETDDQGNPKRNAVVVFFTDGRPNSTTDSRSQYKAANEAVESAQAIKEDISGVKIYSIGAFGESDGNPLTYWYMSNPKSGSPTTSDKYYYKESDLEALYNSLSCEYNGNLLHGETVHGKNVKDNCDLDDAVVTNNNTYKTSIVMPEYLEEVYYSDYYSHSERTSSSTYDSIAKWTWGLTNGHTASGTMQSYQIRWYFRDCLRNNKYYPQPENDTIFDYMQVVSSTYPEATSFDADWYTKTRAEKEAGDYNTTINGVRGTKDSKNYYMLCSNANRLESVFTSIAYEVSNPTSDVALGSQAIVRDVISDNFDLSDGFTASDITINTVEATSFDEDGNPVWGTPTAASNEITATVNGKTINVTGFDISKYYVFKDKPVTDDPGRKLQIIISGIKPNKVGTAIASNDAEKSGVYNADGGNESLVANFPVPTVDTTDKAFYVVEKLIKSDGTTETSTAKTFTFKKYYNEKTDTVSFDLTGQVSDGCMYGGYYTDDGYTTPGTAYGKTLSPGIGKTYYVKSVAKNYLYARNVYLKKWDNILGTYGVAVADDANYDEVGFIVDGNVDNRIPSMKQDDKSTLYSQVTFKNVNNNNPYYPKNLVDGTAVDSAKIAVGKLGESVTGTVQAYWITPDGVLVKGDNIRNLVAGKKDGEDETGKSSVSEAPSKVEYDGALPVNTLFVGNEDGDETIITDDNVKLAGYTTSLNGKIEMNFYLDLAEDVANDEDAYMQFTLPGSNHTAETVKLADAKKTVRGGKAYYVFSAGVAAKDMTSDIKAQFVQGDGTKSEEWTYTIKAYCDYVRNHPDAYDAESVALVENMLNYGGYAQTYFKYNTSNLANADLDLDLPEAKLDDSFRPVITGELEGLTYLGSSAMLTTTTGLRHYFTFEGDAENYTFTANGKTLDVQSDGENSYVLIDNIGAKNLPTAITLTVTDKEGNEISLSYSVYSNIYQIVGNDDYTEASQNLMRALYGYGEAAKTYFATR